MCKKLINGSKKQEARTDPYFYLTVQGYLQWCFTDNFEWAKGDATRVGLVYTDYPTQQRIPKDSAYWYRDVIRNNGSNL